MAWVIDGATDLYQDSVLPAERDVVWLVDFLSAQLSKRGEAGYRGAGSQLLAELAEAVCQEQVRHAFPAGRIPPACSLAIVVDQGDTYDVTRIGDATGIVSGTRLRREATDFFDRRERGGVHDQRNGATADQVREGMLQRRWQTMTGGLPESVFSGHPDRQLRPHTITGPWTEVDQILLCTDGFARIVDDYALYRDWQQVLVDARARGLAYLEKRIRERERDPASPLPARFKRSDDIAVVLLVPDSARATSTREGTSGRASALLDRT